VKRVFENFTIAACGLITSVVVAIANVAIDRLTGFNFFTLSFWIIIPAGALIIGFLAASGYYFGSLYFHKRPNKYLLFQMVVIAGLSQFLIYYIGFNTYYLSDGRKLSDLVSFFDYIDVYLTQSHYKVGRSQIDIGESGNFGYWMAFFQFVGFLVGGFSIYAILTEKAVCERCDYYLRKLFKKDKMFSDADSGAEYFDTLFTHPVDGQEFAEMIRKDCQVLKPQKGALSIHTSLLECSNCKDQIIEEEVQIFTGTDWKEMRNLKRRVKIPTGISIAHIFRN
jgi:hypothetical protein